VEHIIQDIKKQGVLDAVGDGVSIQDTHFRILYQNKRAKDMIGDHVGQFCYEVYERKDNVCEDCPLALSFRDGKSHTVERTNPSTEKPLTVEITTSPLRNNAGNIIAGIEVVRDVTRRKQTENALRESEKNFRDIVSSSLVGIYKTNLKGDILYVNEALAEIFECRSPEEMMSAGVASFYKHPDDRDQFIQELKRSGSVKSLEITALTKTEKTINILLSAVLEDDTISGMIMDITDLKKTEELVKEERDRAQMYLDVAGVMLLALDPEGKVRLINKRGCEILDHREEEIIGKKWFDHFLPANIRNEVFNVFQNLMSGKADLVKYHENPVLTRHGEERIIAWNNVLLQDEQGTITGTLSSGEDVTLRRKIEHELKERIEELELFYNTAIGRELKMKELKTELEQLKAELRKKSQQ
jgi:PAS domain S-box-containing protein